MEYDYSEDRKEDLVFTYLCTKDLESAQHIIGKIKEQQKAANPDKSIIFYLFENLIVTYIRPFTKSKGRKLEPAELTTYQGLKMNVYGKGQYRAHRLSKQSYVPATFVDLHERLEGCRNQQFAHTDPEYFNVQLSNLNTPEDPWWVFALRHGDYEYLEQQFPRIEELVEIVLKKVREEGAAELDYLKTRYVPGPAPSIADLLSKLTQPPPTA
jgi:hypothetical protein